MFAPLILIILIALTVYLITGWVKRRNARRCPKYQYKYMPALRTFTEQQTEPASVFKMYKDMFWQQSPWVSTHANPQEFSNGYINPFVWGELPTTDVGTVRESNDFVNDAYGN